MTREHLEHLLRAAGAIVGDDQFIVMGSQSILAKIPDAKGVLALSMEADLISKNKPKDTDLLNAIGQDSPFHSTYGYYADPVDERTATLPRGWKGRLVNLNTPATNGVTGLCLDPHDLVLSKYAAGREKDILFNQSVIDGGHVQMEKLLGLLEDMLIDEDRRSAIERKILVAFGKCSENTPVPRKQK